MRRFLEASGDIGQDLLALDWDATPLGPPETWSRSLQNAVRIVLTSKFSMWMAWGHELTFFCNEAYRRDTLGSKYPWALGKPASTVWSEIWDDISPRINRVMSTGDATWDESLQLFLERSGYVEETYHTFSYSPLADDAGRINGMLCVVKEDTEQVVSARRLATLRDLGTRSTNLTEAETIAGACRHLAGNPWSVPFALVYLFDGGGQTATLAGAAGIGPDHAAADAAVRLGDPEARWPVGALAAGRTATVDLTPEHFPDLPSGAWPEPPERALAVPLMQPRQGAPYGFLVAALNRYRPLDDSYRTFADLMAGQLAAAITDARAYEFERQRAESLAEIDRAKTDFFTNVSHEFRTPLTLLLGPAEDALVDDLEPLPPDQRARVEVIQRNGRRLLKLVNSLLDFSRLESGRITARFEPVDLAHYTAELVAMFEASAARAGLTLTVECPPLSSSVHVDQDHWAKIVLNLVSNALKFTFEGGITVALTEVDGVVRLTVSDTGTGIPETELPLLFERFHRVHGARARTYEGSGIGLALVSELAALHGGTVTAESTVGLGTSFVVQVPFGTAHLPAEQVAAEGHAVDPAQRASTFVNEAMRWLEDAGQTSTPLPVPALEAGDTTVRARVLVVDDNADMRDYVRGLLALEYDVLTAVDGVDALEKAAAWLPDLLLTDVMMPRLDGFGLLRKLQADPATVGIPVIMLSARAGEEGTIEGLEAGADDYLVKPFSARELLARVKVNLELDRVRRVRTELERSQELLDQAERLARVGSWEIDLDTGALSGSDELVRLLDRSREEFVGRHYRDAIEELVHPDDREAVVAAIQEAFAGSGISEDARVVLPSGAERLVQVRGVAVRDGGRPVLLRGSLQDITEQHQAEETLATARALEESAAREHEIADELQRSLMPERSFALEHLDVATFYQAGVEGTQVGGDWYDIIELGAGRTALVVGDVMGRGVSAAAVMGQLRSAVRAFAKLDLPPGEVLEHLEDIVQDLGVDQIVTCVYAVFDSTDQVLHYANAGHLPPLLTAEGGEVLRLEGGAGPPLGAGYFSTSSEVVQLRPSSTVTFYTDGLVERRDRDIDTGIDALCDQLAVQQRLPLDEVPTTLVDALLPDGPDDDIAILVARVNAEPFEAAVSHRVGTQEPAVSNARRLVEDQLRSWDVPDDVADDMVLMTSELVTNAFLHGRAPIDLRLRRTGSELMVEVQDRTSLRPRRRRADEEDEHGRGLEIVSSLADRWGSRATGTGKSVWCSKSLAAVTSGLAERLGP